MNQNIIIRKAVIEDAETIIRFNRNMAKETEHKDLDYNIISNGVKNLFAHPEYGFYIVAEIDNKIAGCLMITYEWSDWRDGLFWWIQSVYVPVEHRRKGVYKSMYEWIKKFAGKTPGVCGYRLYVEQDNVMAQKTYEKLGMELTVYKMYEEIK